MLFTETQIACARDSERFVNPNIKSIAININGMPNNLCSKGMVPTEFWESTKKRFSWKDSGIK